MTNDKSPRERAESHFSKMPSPASARERAFDELAAIKDVRDEKTLRLRESRIARDLQDGTRPTGRASSRKDKS